MLLEFMEAKRLLNRYGIKSIESRYVKSADEAVEFAAGEPIVLKAISEKALHKSKAGLVMLQLEGEKKIKKAYASLVKKADEFAPYKILAQRMAKSGVEIIIGGKIDEQFGKMILLGLGGIYVEAFRDFALRVCPITRYDAEEMIEQLRSKDIVTYNGEAREILVRLLLNVSHLLVENDIKELDLNPIILRKNGYDAVDLRLIV